MTVSLVQPGAAPLGVGLPAAAGLLPREPRPAARSATPKTGRCAAQTKREELAFTAAYAALGTGRDHCLTKGPNCLTAESTDDDMFPGEWHLKAAKMLRADLEAAKIPFETAEGVVDFHALRVTYGTNLARIGMLPAIAQTMMRHSTINLTLEVYTRFTSDEVTDAIDKLA